MKRFVAPMLVKGKRVTGLYSRLIGAYNDYHFRAKLRANLRQRNAILIHQMGKVGSSSLILTLEALRVEPTYLPHTFLES